jgi:hypothetical protein
MRAILVLAMLLTAAPALAQFPLGIPLAAVWTAPDNEAATQVTHYQIVFDNDPLWSDSGNAVPLPEYRYQLPAARLTAGTHQIQVRACAWYQCGDVLQIVFSVGVPVPGIPRNGTIRPGDLVALNERQAVDVANAYATLAIRRPLTRAELEMLGIRHGPGPWTMLSLLNLLDGAYAEWVNK